MLIIEAVREGKFQIGVDYYEFKDVIDRELDDTIEHVFRELFREVFPHKALPDDVTAWWHARDPDTYAKVVEFLEDYYAGKYPALTKFEYCKVVKGTTPYEEKKLLDDICETVVTMNDLIMRLEEAGFIVKVNYNEALDRAYDYLEKLARKVERIERAKGT